MSDAVVRQSLASNSPRLRALSDRLCASPELGRHEFKAHETLTSLLDDLGFSVQPHTPSPTAFLASWGNARPHVALLCEYDALPGIGHACGHNLIAETAVGAGAAVAAAMAAGETRGTVSVIGTPAEETDGGKIDLVDAGFFAEIDAALMVHPVGGRMNVVGPHTNATFCFEAEFVGKAAHVESAWRGVNALDAAVTAYQSIAKLRQHLPPHCRVCAVIYEGGETPSVVPERSTLKISIRAPSTKIKERLVRRVNACLKAAAEVTGCELNASEPDKPYAELRSSPALCRVYTEQSEALHVPVVQSRHFEWSTDAGNVSHVTPTIHPVFQIDANANIHEREFAVYAESDAAQKFVMQQAEILAMTALSVLNDEQLRSEMRSDLRRQQEEEGI